MIDLPKHDLLGAAKRAVLQRFLLETHDLVPSWCQCQPEWNTQLRSPGTAGQRPASLIA